MKKITKIALTAAAVAMVGGAVAFAGCDNATKTYTGEYQYTAWGTNYGIKVEVAVTGEKIDSVKVLDSNYVSVTGTWADKAVWENGLEGLLAKYEGKTVEEVLAVKVNTETTGAPVTADKDNFTYADYNLAGATQGAGRLLLAVQDALNGENTYTGEYQYTAWGTNYGVKVEVKVDQCKVTSVSIVDSDYVEVSEGWTDKAVWENGVEGLLAKYTGKTVEEIMGTTVATNESGVPATVTDPNFSYEAYNLAGATQGAGRVLLAVQDALGTPNTAYSVTGEYQYTAWNTNYGVKVNVLVKGGKIAKVAIVESDYVEVTDSWTDKATWTNGVAGLLAKYEGKAVADVLAITVNTDENGAPVTADKDNFTYADYNLAGATQGAGRVLLAVQNALAKLA